MIDELKSRIAEIEDDLVAWRRDFHRHPEVAFHEERTSRVIKEYLEGLGLPVKTLAGTGLRADLRGGGDGPTVALRARLRRRMTTCLDAALDHRHSRRNHWDGAVRGGLG